LGRLHDCDVLVAAGREAQASLGWPGLNAWGGVTRVGFPRAGGGPALPPPLTRPRARVNAVPHPVGGRPPPSPGSYRRARRPPEPAPSTRRDAPAPPAFHALWHERPVTHVTSLDDEDHVLGDIGGVIADALQVTRDEDQFQARLDRRAIAEHVCQQLS